MVETIEVIHTNDYGKTCRYKTHTRDPVKEVMAHINEKYFQNKVIEKEIKKE